MPAASPSFVAFLSDLNASDEFLAADSQAPELRLWAAVFFSAIEDAIHATDNSPRNSTPSLVQRIQDDAYNWFFWEDQRKDVGSFNWLVDTLGLNKSTAQEGVRALIKQARTSGSRVFSAIKHLSHRRLSSTHGFKATSFSSAPLRTPQERKQQKWLYLRNLSTTLATFTTRQLPPTTLTKATTGVILHVNLAALANIKPLKDN